MSKKNNGQKTAPPTDIDLTREEILELRYLTEAQRRVNLQSARLQEDSDKITKETITLRKTLQEKYKVDVLGNYAIDFDSQKANLRQEAQQQPPTPIVEAEAEEAPEPVASA